MIANDIMPGVDANSDLDSDDEDFGLFTVEITIDFYDRPKMLTIMSDISGEYISVSYDQMETLAEKMVDHVALPPVPLGGDMYLAYTGVYRIGNLMAPNPATVTIDRGHWPLFIELVEDTVRDLYNPKCEDPEVKYLR